MDKENFNLKKEQYRGTIKQIMKVRGLRSINISNYFIWNSKSEFKKKLSDIHSLKMDLQDGYLNVFQKGNGLVAGKKMNDVSVDTYKILFDTVIEIINKESDIDQSVRRNILVKVNR